MAETYRDRYAGDAVEIAKASREKNRERKARYLARLAERGKALPTGVVRPELWQGEVPRDWAGVGDDTQPVDLRRLPPTDAEALAAALPAVIEEKREPKMEKPKVDKGDGRVPVHIRVDFGDRVLELDYRTNMRSTLMHPQMTDDAMRERFARLMKENFGLSK